ncbi:MAG: hypothetical protein IPG96_17085 [Proteobacteria bacterium]|nr:hypothetical protein [Pseudomonadota bacterium]
MAELRLLALDEALSDEKLARLRKKLAEYGVRDLPEGDDAADVEEVLSEHQLTDFQDRLEAHDIACDVYLPVDFEGRFDIGDRSFGSAHALLAALDELRDELDVEHEGDSEGDEKSELEMIDEQLGAAWRVFARAVNACIERQVPLHVIS